MTHGSTRSIAFLTALLMAWTGVWCCCTPPTRAVHVRACCVEQPRMATSGCPMPDKSPGGECPIASVRQISVAPLPAVTPPAHDVVLALPTPLAALPTLITTPSLPRYDAVADPPGEPPTLLALHTSLVT